jgi:hypothetical protein
MFHLGDTDLAHLHHRLHCAVRVWICDLLKQSARPHLPGQSPAVLKPTAWTSNPSPREHPAFGNSIPWRVATITADNGTEFHRYQQIEAISPVKFYFANPHHSLERGTNENPNGLIRQYLPKGQSMVHQSKDNAMPSPNTSTTDPAKDMHTTHPPTAFLPT